MASKDSDLAIAMPPPGAVPADALSWSSMERDQDTDHLPWWRLVINTLGGALAILLFGGLIIGLIVFVTAFIDRDPPPRPAVFIDLTTPPPPAENARTRVPQPHEPVPWPDHPGRSAWSRDDGGGEGGAGAPASARGEPPAPASAVGISIEQYRAAVQSGERIVLPNPQGECDLSGTSAALSADALENCFARQAAR